MIAGMVLCVVTMAGQPTGLVNGSFELDADGDGVPDGWASAGNESVTQRLTREPNPDGGFCAKLACTAYQNTSPASHAMLAQMDTISLQRGQWYRFQARLRGDKVVGGAIHIALSNTEKWGNCGLQADAYVDDQWHLFETFFQASQTISDHIRLQLWWTSVGTVWFDDVSLEETEPPKRLNLERIAPTDARNKLPNGGFEAGAAGWGSITDVSGWGGNFNRLFGDVVTEGAHSGRSCLRIALTPETTPTIWFDYFTLTQQRVLMPLAANRGWIGVEPGHSYTLSAWLRAEPAGLTAVLRAVHGNRRREDQRVEVPGDWSRVSATLRAQSDQLCIAIGPDLAVGDHDRGTLWLDDVMVEDADQPGTYAPRSEVSIGVRAAADGGLFEPGTTPAVTATVANQGAAERTVDLHWSATDLRDEPVGEWHREVKVAAGSATDLNLPLDGAGRGFYRVTVTADGADVSPPLPLRLAVLASNRRDDTICGMNHAYPTGDLLDLSRRIGLGWFRDWSYKWHDVEPQQGKFDFTGPDAQVDRVRQHDLRVLVLLPFPSSTWSTAAPAEVGGESYEGHRERVSFAPKDPDDLANYVHRTVDHLRGKVDAFEIFNEPVYTSYSLPQAHGYTVKDYVDLLAVASRAARAANPDALVVGGLQNAPGPLTDQLIDLGGLSSIDALSFHSYPGMARPETLVEPFAKLRAKLAAAGRDDMPLWWTEGAYYADDDLPFAPYTDWLHPLPDEYRCACYTVRLNAILCGHGTRRIIYHSGTPGEINRETLSGIYFEYDGLPRKMTPALATFNELLGPDLLTLGRLPSPDEVYAFGFTTGGRTVVVAWSLLEPHDWTVDRRTWTALDMMGNPLPDGPVHLGEEPVYLVADARVSPPDLR